MGRTKIAAFRRKSYETLQGVARSSRMRKTIAAPCVSSLFTATKRIVGLCAASQIASASAASFFCRLTKGLT